jgi:peptidoglycan hydrolase CwlO-like protein
MEKILAEIWPPIFGALIAAIGLYAGYIRNLIVDVAVLKKTVEDQQNTISNMTKRLDAHSKKQDEMYDTLTDMKVELLKEIAHMNTNIGALAADVKNLNQMLTSMR